MRRLTWRELTASVLVLLVAVPYLGYVLRGEMPFVQDARGMAAVGLLLGAAAYAVLTTGGVYDRVGWIETAVAVVSLLLGIAALALAETAAAGVLLAAFVLSIVVVVGVEIADHAGLVHWHGPGPTHA